MADLLARAAELVDIPSESGHEAELVAHIEAELARVGGLEVCTVGDNLVARTHLGRSLRLVLAGHTDTVPVNGNGRALVEGDRLSGLGAADMKGGLAVMVELARTVTEPAVDVTYVFYAGRRSPPPPAACSSWPPSDPTCWSATSPCSANPPRPRSKPVARAPCACGSPWPASARTPPGRGWDATPSIGAARVVDAVAASEERQPVIEGCRYREALQVVGIEGGVAPNVVPDRAELTINHRFAPDRTPAEAEAHVREVLAGVVDADDGDTVEVVDVAAVRPGHQPPPGGDARLPERLGRECQARLDRRRPLRRRSACRRPTSGRAPPSWPTPRASS